MGAHMKNPLSLTHAAKTKAIEKTTSDNNKNIRLGLKASGCAGYEYIIEYADEINEGDMVFDYGQFNIVIDKDHEKFFQGAVLDWVYVGLNQNFKVINPNETYSCGCGVSVKFED